MFELRIADSSLLARPASTARPENGYLLLSVVAILLTALLPAPTQAAEKSPATRDSTKAAVPKPPGLTEDRYSDLTTYIPDDPFDLDANGIPDSVDTRRGYAHDLNHNGIIDPFEAEAVSGSFNPVESEWKREARHADTLNMVRLFTPYVGYSIMCYVPKSAGDARLVVRASDGREIAVISQCVSPGPSGFYWPLRNKDGSTLDSDVEYRLCLETSRRSVSHLVRWRVRLRN